MNIIIGCLSANGPVPCSYRGLLGDRTQKQINNDFDINATVGWNFYRKEVENRREDGQSLASRGFFNIASASSVSVVERPTKKELYGVYGDFRLAYKNMVFLNLGGYP